MMLAPRTRTALASLSFAAAGACFAFGLLGRSGAWIAAMVAALGFLTAAYFIAIGRDDA